MIFLKKFFQVFESQDQKIQAFIAGINFSGLPFCDLFFLEKIDGNDFFFLGEMPSKNASACFFFDKLGKQVRVEGIVSTISQNSFKITPQRLEFWCEGKFRIHRRDIFEKCGDENWKSKKIYP